MTTLSKSVLRWNFKSLVILPGNLKAENKSPEDSIQGLYYSGATGGTIGSGIAIHFPCAPLPILTKYRNIDETHRDEVLMRPLRVHSSSYS